ncbi:MAG: hypothetical protein EOP13_31705, partial [Pseudomonas sp.]|uniref:hypothetical protein n=1 Tax=Pseudomonas sp. TaxID=306 RepID=UPI00121AD285
LRGMDDALAVISASTDNIDIMHQVLAEQAALRGLSEEELRPEQWLAEFYASRKGSGKAAASSTRDGKVARQASVLGA